jgi:signal transduction histidine kinase
MLVDDDPGSLVLLRRALAPLGYELVEATDGRSAVARFDAARPDLVLLDLVMPGLDGLGVLAQIRTREPRSYVPVVVLTAHAERERRLQGLEAGADDFFEKPVDPPTLRARVTTLLRLKESRDGLQALSEELAVRNAAMEQLQREQRELMAFIVHDLKNPLSALQTNLELIGDEPALRPPAREALGESMEDSRRLRAMIEDLLVVSRLEESAFPIRLETTAIGELLQDVLREYVRRAENQRVQLHGVAPRDSQVKTDRALLRRVIENILDNSLRYTPANGRVRVAARLGDGVEITVSNTGPSIPLAERARIFDKFSRIEGRTQSRSNVGLGLYFCKRAVTSLGGQIEVTETTEWPTSFVVRLPTSSAA